MGAIMINIFDHMPSVAFFKANADQLGAQNYSVALNQLSQLSALGIDEVNTPDFELTELSEEVFLSQAKAYTFKFNNIECAYLMLKVLSTTNESLWLAAELRQFKDSWFFDFADVCWLSLKVADTGAGLAVEELRLFPIALLTQFKDVEIQLAFAEFEAYKEKVALLRKHSNWVEHCFDPRESVSWLWTVSKFGYCLSQYSSTVLVQPNSGIKIKNQPLPFILEHAGNQYKALSLAVQVGSADNDDCFWLTTLFNAENQLKTEGFIVSYGHYPHELPARKLVAPNFVEQSVFLEQDESPLTLYADFLKGLMIEKHLIDEYSQVLKGILATYLNPAFQNRLLYSCEYIEKVDASRLTLTNESDLSAYLVNCDQFVSNQPLYHSITSFPATLYVPSLENSIVEDIPESLKVVEGPVVDDAPSIYDEKQPDFNSENNRFGVMNTPSTPVASTPYKSGYGHQSGKRILESSPMAMNAKHHRSSSVDDVDNLAENNERKRRNQKSQPVVVHRRRWGLVAKERRDQIQQELAQGTVNQQVSNDDWDLFKQSIDKVTPSQAAESAPVEASETAQAKEVSNEAVTASVVEKASQESLEAIFEAPVTEVAVVKEEVEESVVEAIAKADVTVEVPVVAAVAPVLQEKEEVTFETTIENLNIKLANELVITLNPHGVRINYPKALIENDHNFIFNNLIALGIDPYQSCDILKAIDAPLKRYSYAMVNKLVKQASTDDLKLYKGFELYVDLVERELNLRNKKGL